MKTIHILFETFEQQPLVNYVHRFGATAVIVVSVGLSVRLYAEWEFAGWFIELKLLIYKTKILLKSSLIHLKVTNSKTNKLFFLLNNKNKS